MQEVMVKPAKSDLTRLLQEFNRPRFEPDYENPWAFSRLLAAILARAWYHLPIGSGPDRPTIR